MRLVATLTMLTALAFSTLAQSQDTSPIRMEGAPDTIILGTFLQDKGKGNTVAFSIELQNTGKKVIEAVGWEYYLPIPGGKDATAIRLSLQSERVMIQPGEKKFLQGKVEGIFNPDVSRIRPTKIRLVRVEYDDGTKWQRPSE